jgi:hypothetical protein
VQLKYGDFDGEEITLADMHVALGLLLRLFGKRKKR